MSDFRALSDTFLASPQIELEDIVEAAQAGVTLVVNNRPDGEDPGAPQSDAIAAACDTSGIAYVAIPIGHSGFSEAQIGELINALEGVDGKTLAYCRSGTRSTCLWSLAQAKQGTDPEAIVRAASQAGYDVSPIRPMLDMLASG